MMLVCGGAIGRSWMMSPDSIHEDKKTPTQIMSNI
jgi:hypothetical protein